MNGHKKPVPVQNSAPIGVFPNRTVASGTPPTDFAENISAPFGLIDQQLQSKAEDKGSAEQTRGVAAAVEYVTGVDGKELTMTGPVSAFVPGLAQNLHPVGLPQVPHYHKGGDSESVWMADSRSLPA
jgi:hypothetical protein